MEKLLSKQNYLNYFSILSLQAVTYLLPLVIFPYLILKLGVDNFGKMTYILSIIFYCELLINFGFNLTATNEIAKTQEKEQVSIIVSNVFFLKSVFFIFSVLVILLLLKIGLLDRHDENLYLIALSKLIGEVFFLRCFYNGVRLMKLLPLFTFFSNLVYLLFIYFLVKDQNDLHYALMSLSLSKIVLGLGSFLYYIFVAKHSIFKPKVDILLDQLTSGFWAFANQMSVSFYSTFQIIMLGNLTSISIVGIYAIAEKIINALGQMSSAFAQSTYPYLAKTFKISPNQFFKKANQAGVIMLLTNGLIVIGLFLFKRQIIGFLIHDQAQIRSVIHIINMLLPYLLIYSLVGYLSRLLVILKKVQELFYITFSVGVLSVLVGYLLISSFEEAGLVVLKLLTVLTLFVCNYHKFLKVKTQTLAA